MLLWLLPQGSGSSNCNGNTNGKDRSNSGCSLGRAAGSNAQAPIYYYCSMLLVSLTLVLARLYKHIHLDSRHEHLSPSLYLRPILSIPLSSQHFHRQSQQQYRGWVVIASMAIPVLSKTIQAAPVVRYEAIMRTDKRAYAVAVERPKHTDDEDEPTGLVPPPPPPPYDTNYNKPSKSTVPTTTPNPTRPTTTITTTTKTTSKATFFTSATTPYRDPSFPTAVAAQGVGPSYPVGDWGTVAIVGKEAGRPDSVFSIVNGAVLGLTVLVIAAVVVLVVRRWRRRMNSVQQELDFGGAGAYPRNGESNKRQKKTEHHVGLSSFGSVSSSMIGSVRSSRSGSGLSPTTMTPTTTAMAMIKKPAAAMVVKKQTAATAAVATAGVEKPVLTQFWNP